MRNREFKDRVYERVALDAKALSSPKRVEIVELLAQIERTLEWLAEATGMSVANTSQPLQVMRGARLVESRKDGPYVCEAGIDARRMDGGLPEWRATGLPVASDAA